ncbi:MAG: hypothetical protein H0U71_08235 [Gammaproteobacteria bacterium]|nr:hypothetical protein [Gammaproteobacteria bacterium]
MFIDLQNEQISSIFLSNVVEPNIYGGSPNIRVILSDCKNEHAVKYFKENILNQCSSAELHEYFQQHHIMIDGTEFRTFFNQLFNNNIMTAHQRAVIEPIILKSEDTYYLHSKIVSTITSAQKDVIADFLNTYAENLFTNMSLLEALENISSFKKYVDGESLPTSNSFDLYFFKKKRREQPILESLMVLCRLLNGRANLENTFLKIGGGIPDLETQRNIINNYLYDQCIKCYSVDNKLICFLINLIILSEVSIPSALKEIDLGNAEATMKNFFTSYSTISIFNKIYSDDLNRLKKAIIRSLEHTKFDLKELQLERFMLPDQIEECRTVFNHLDENNNNQTSPDFNF